MRLSAEQRHEAKDGKAKHAFHRGHNLHAVIAARLALCVLTSLGAQRPALTCSCGAAMPRAAPRSWKADPADPSQVRGFDVGSGGAPCRGLGGRTARFVQVQWSNIDESVERGDFTLASLGVEDTPARRTRHAVTLPTSSSGKCSPCVRRMPAHPWFSRTCAVVA